VTSFCLGDSGIESGHLPVVIIFHLVAEMGLDGGASFVLPEELLGESVKSPKGIDSSKMLNPEGFGAVSSGELPAPHSVGKDKSTNSPHSAKEFVWDGSVEARSGESYVEIPVEYSPPANSQDPSSELV
jgi:hypothetical protein